jgi:TonB family protein
MKTYIKIALSLLMLIGIGCGHNVEKADSYSPPSIKFQPRLFYPRYAQQNALFGSSKFLVQINKAGTVDKVFLLKSSGYAVLDSSAQQYCNEVTFVPALRNGDTIESRMFLNIKFDLSNYVWDTKDYIEDVNKLYTRAKESDSSERSMVEKQILKWHIEFLEQMRDLVIFNNTIQQVISPALINEWKNDMDGYPLSFLLIHDFIQNFNDYKDMKSAKAYLLNALKCDIKFIKAAKLTGVDEIKKRDILLNRIKTLIINKYPEFSLEELGYSKISS